MDISVIIPLYNEAESLPELSAWIERVMTANSYTYEIIFINDGSTDNSWEIIEKLQEKNNNIHGIKFRRNYGKSPALYCGFERAKGNVVITMDADLQEPRRNTHSLQNDNRGWIRPCIGLQKETLRPTDKNHPHKTVQRHRTQSLGNKKPARLQLRP